MHSLAPACCRSTGHIKGHHHAAVVPHLQLLTRKTKQDVRVSALYDVTKGAAPAAEPPTTTPVAEAAASGVTAPPSAPEVPEPSAAQQLYQEPAARSLEAAAGQATESSSNQGVTLPDLPDLPDLGSAAANIGDSASKAVDIVTGAASKAAESLSAAVSGLTGGVSSKVTDLTSGVGKGAGDVTGQLGGVVSGALDSVKGGLEQVVGNLDQATAGASSTVGQALAQLTESSKAVTSVVSDNISSGQAVAQQTLDSVNAQATAVATQVSTAVESTTIQVLNSLPPPVKDAALAVGDAVAAAAHAAADHPQAAAVVTTAVAVPTAVKYYKGRYGGFAGELGPIKVAELLSISEEKVFLVDIRSEATREQEGIPQLKMSARFKVAAFPLQTGLVPKRILREAANADELTVLVNAAYISGLAPVQSNLTRIVIMDTNGGDKARAVARALVTLGYGLSYIMEGGFRGWVEADLPVLEEATEYDASTGAVISDNIEIVAEKASAVAETLAQPRIGVPVLGGTVLGGYALYNYHTSLQFIGVLSILLTITRKVLSYDSPGALLEDFQNTADNVSKAVKDFKLPSAPKLPSVPKLRGLPGSASTSAVPAPATYGGATDVDGRRKEPAADPEPAGQQEVEVVEQQ